MLKDTLNKGISTPIAIGIVLILVVLVGGFTWLQYGEIWREVSELPEVELPEKELYTGKPYIKVISPSGGENWIIGNTYDIIWESKGYHGMVYITLINEERDWACRLTSGYISVEEGKYSWEVDANICSTLYPGDKFKIKVNEEEGMSIPRLDNESDDYFSIEERGSCRQETAMAFGGTAEFDPCDRSCLSDQDCKEECGCKCVSKDEKCIYTGIECEFTDSSYGCKCVDGFCEYQYVGGEEEGKGLTARETLIRFFHLLNTKQYKEATEYYGGSYGMLEDWNPLVYDHDKLLKNGCENNGLNCLAIREILEEEEISPTEVKFTIQLSNDDGTLFKRGPCCGATEEQMPTKTDFEYTVIKKNNKFLSRNLPPYTP